jgi:dipeptidyl aminopeptidase/acylaminoacyl peptidase
VLTLKGHKGGVAAVAFSPDGRRILTGGQDRAAVLWSVTQDTPLLSLSGHNGGITAVAFSSDGRQIATGSLDQTAKVWMASNGTEVLTLKGHSGGISGIAFSPDGRQIVTGSLDGTAKLWDGATGRELLTIKGHSSKVLSVAFSPDGRRIVTSSADQTAKVWEAADAAQVVAWQMEEEDAQARLVVRQRQRAESAKDARIQRAQNAGAIRQWLVLGPISCPSKDGTTNVDTQQIVGEASLHPRAGEEVKVNKTQRTWRAMQLDDDVIDFNEFMGGVIDWSAAYAVTYIQSEVNQRGLVLNIGSDDEAKVYLNGKEIYRRAYDRTYVADQDTVGNVELHAGVNTVQLRIAGEA